MKQANIIVLYGPIATGKLTIGELLSKKLGYKLSHNHLINDLVWSIYERDTIDGNRIIEELRYKFYEEAACSRIDLIITHTYASDFISMTGLSDPEYMKKLESIFEKFGANINFVHIKANKKTLLERVNGPSRTQFKKLTDKKMMGCILDEKDFETSAPIKNNFTIDNSDQTPEESVAEILSHIK